MHKRSHTHTHTHLNRYTCMYVFTNTCVYEHAHTNTYVCAYIETYTHIHVYKHTHKHIYIYVYTYMCIDIYTHACTLTYVLMNTYGARASRCRAARHGWLPHLSLSQALPRNGGPPVAKTNEVLVDIQVMYGGRTRMNTSRTQMQHIRIRTHFAAQHGYTKCSSTSPTA